MVVSGFDLGIVIAALVATLFIGVWASTKIKNTEDYFLSGRNLGLIVLVCTLAATEIHPGTVIGQGSRGYELGLYGLWWPIIFGSSLVLSAAFLAARYARLRQTTVADYIEMRYGRVASGIMSIVLISTMTAMLGVYLFGTTLVFKLALGWDMGITAAVLFSVAVLYTILGGFKAVAYTDILQMVLLVVGITVTFFVAMFQAGGFGALHTAFPPELMSLRPLSATRLPELSLGVIIGFFISQNGVWAGAPWYAQRLYAAKSVKIGYTAYWWNVVFVTAIYIMTMLTAAFVRVLNPEIPPDHSVAYAFIHLAPIGIVGLALAGMMGVFMSTTDSILNTNVTMIMKDWYMKYIKPNQTERHYLLVARVLTVILGILSLIIVFQISGILWFFIMHIGLALGMGLTPVYLGFFWSRANQKGVVTGLLAGIIFYAVQVLIGGSFEMKSIGTHVIIFVVTVVVSLLTASESEEKLTKFYSIAGPPLLGRKYAKQPVVQQAKKA